MIFKGPPLKLEYLRDALTIPQFILDESHPLRPHRGPERPWLIDDATGRSYNLEEIRERVFGLANALSALYGIKEDDVVVIFSPNDIEYPILLWAIHRLGAIASCANPSYTAPELEYQLRATSAKFIITHTLFLPTALAAARSISSTLVNHLAVIHPPRHAYHPSSSHFNSHPNAVEMHAEALEEAKSQVPSVQSLIARGLSDLSTNGPAFVERRLSPGEARTKVAFLSFSSGTTGPPKAVAISHYNVTSNVVQMATTLRSNDAGVSWERRRMRDGDVASCVLPMFHIYGLVMVMHFNLFMGLPLVVTPRYNLVDFLKGVVKHRITHLYVVPPQLIDMVKRPEAKAYNLSHVRWIMSGAAPLSTHLDAAVRKMLPNADLGQGYGATETAATISMWNTPEKGSEPVIGVGQLLAGWEAKVVKESLRDSSVEELAGIDEPGELYLRGPSVALRYEGNEGATKETFIESDGGVWLRMGDQVVFDKRGEMFVVDRLKDVLKVKGNQVAPAELEDLLIAHPDVLDACVVGVPDERAGELPFAFVVLQPRAAAKAHLGSTARTGRDHKELESLRKAIVKYVEERKIRYKWLAGGVVFVDTIPKNPSGKILRRVLKGEAAKYKKIADAAKAESKL